MTFENEIHASHPMRFTDNQDKMNSVYKADVLAMKLVGERHEKRDLVNLVRWLILDQSKIANENL